jgi:hypothetical protein
VETKGDNYAAQPESDSADSCGTLLSEANIINGTMETIHGVLKRALQWYSKCYCVVIVTKTFTLKGLQTIHLSTP